LIRQAHVRLPAVAGLSGLADYITYANLANLNTALRGGFWI
jgi:hypothetical protein